tara:strand:+ start:3192 stop:4199 length:1008 start_codon:yes stop_codon:yes gene_type:complete
MRFFDPKEEVLDLEITPYGETLLKNGIFKPVYYAFFDDDIMYDGTAASVEELQNQIEERIQTNTPRLKTQYIHTGLETSLQSQLDNIFDGRTPDPEEFAIIQPTIERDFTLVSPIGSMEIGSEFSPSWSLRCLKGKIREVENHLSSSANSVKRVPQVDMDNTFKVAVENINAIDDRKAFNRVAISSPYSDGTFLYKSIDRTNMIFSIDELNSSAGTEYDVEVFLVETGSVVADGTETETLIPLKFQKQYQQVVDGFLVDDPELQMWTSSTDPTYVEYYFQLNADHEISEEEICPLINDVRFRDVFVENNPFACDDVAPALPLFDVYYTDDEYDCP